MFIIFILGFLCPFFAQTQTTDKQFEWLVEPIYDYVGDFKEGLAAVKLNGKWGIINKMGKVIVEPQYDYINNLVEGLFRVALNGNWGFLDKTGKVVVEIKYRGASDLSEGLARVQLNNKWGFVDKTGKVVVEIKYREASDLSEGLAAVRLNDKWGFIDKTGKVVIDIKYDGASPFSEGLASVAYVDKNIHTNKNEDQYGFINQKGEVAFQTFKYISNGFHEGLCCHRYSVSSKEDKWETAYYAIKVIDKFGYSVFSFHSKNAKEDMYIDDFQNGLVQVKFRKDRILWWDSYIKIVDRTGNFICKTEFRNVGNFSDGLAWAILKKKVGFINTMGEMVIKPQFESANNFSEGLAAVRLNGKAGFIDKTGKMIIEPQFEFANNFSEGLCATKINRKWGFIKYPLLKEKTKKQELQNFIDVDSDIPVTASPNDYRFALIIGNEKYQKECQVAFAENDALVFKQYAIKTLGVPEKNIIFGLNVAARGMYNSIEQLQNFIKAKEGKAEVVVYYAGHGGVKEETKEPFLLPVDVSNEDLKNENLKFAVSIGDLYKKLTAFPSVRVVVFFDACFSGAVRTDASQQVAQLRELRIRITPVWKQPVGKIIVFAACEGEQTAMSFQGKKHGMFTYFLLSALKTSNLDRLTLGELFEKIRENTATEAARENKEQNPTFLIGTGIENWDKLKLR